MAIDDYLRDRKSGR